MGDGRFESEMERGLSTSFANDMKMLSQSIVYFRGVMVYLLAFLLERNVQ